MTGNGEATADLGVIDAGHDIVATTLSERGLHLLEPDDMQWRPPARRPVLGAAPQAPSEDHRPGDPGTVQEKFLVYALPGEDRFPISVVKFPPGYTFPRHWHTDGEFVCVRSGSLTIGGRTLGRGDMAYVDARTVYGPIGAGPEGCEFLLLRRAWAETHTLEREPGVPDDVLDPGGHALAASHAARGVHLFDTGAIPWTMTLQRPVQGRAPLLPEDDRRPVVEGGLLEKGLIYPLPGDDRFPISIIRFPPSFTFARHWHTDGEFVMILAGTANFAGRELGPGAMAYNDARTVYGAESAGPEGCDFLLIRRAWAETHVVA